MNHIKFKWQAIYVVLLLSACTKIDSTRLGSELLPVVDNVTTFDTILTVVANNYIGNEEYRLNASNPHVVGAISQDPLFGTSKATMFFEMQPSSYPFTFVPHADSLKGTNVGFDSAVLILEYQTYYGDSSTPLNLKLYQVKDSINRDTALTPAYNLNANGLEADHSILWGSATVQANKFKDSVSIIRGTTETGKVANQLRIRLDDNLARQMFNGDSLLVYKSDTTFRSNYPGFVLEAEPSAKTLLYLSIIGTSKIEFFYRSNPGKVDTTSASFTFTSRGGHAVKYETDRSGAEVNTALIPDPVNGNDNIYIQTSPGTSAKISIPGLETFKLTNRILHRAELRITQVENAQSQLIPPQALYLDVVDTVTDIYKGIPYDLSPFTNYYCYPVAGVNFGYFGGITQYEKIDEKSLAVYRFNITRYLQSVLSRNEPVYDLRLSAPFYMYYDNCANNNVAYPAKVFPFGASQSSGASSLLNPPGKGRVKLAGGGSTVNEKVRMQLRIIYSTL